MIENQTMTTEELEKHIKKIEYELNTSLRIEKKLTQALASKEHELAILSVKFEDVAKGFNDLKEKYEKEIKAE